MPETRTFRVGDKVKYNSTAISHGLSQSDVGSIRFIISMEYPSVTLSRRYGGTSCMYVPLTAIDFVSSRGSTPAPTDSPFQFRVGDVVNYIPGYMTLFTGHDRYIITVQGSNFELSNTPGGNRVGNQPASNLVLVRRPVQIGDRARLSSSYSQPRFRGTIVTIGERFESSGWRLNDENGRHIGYWAADGDLTVITGEETETMPTEEATPSEQPTSSIQVGDHVKILAGAVGGYSGKYFKVVDHYSGGVVVDPRPHNSRQTARFRFSLVEKIEFKPGDVLEGTEVAFNSHNFGPGIRATVVSVNIPRVITFNFDSPLTRGPFSCNTDYVRLISRLEYMVGDRVKITDAEYAQPSTLNQEGDIITVQGSADITVRFSAPLNIQQTYNHGQMEFVSRPAGNLPESVRPTPAPTTATEGAGMLGDTITIPQMSSGWTAYEPAFSAAIPGRPQREQVETPTPTGPPATMSSPVLLRKFFRGKKNIASRKFRVDSEGKLFFKSSSGGEYVAGYKVPGRRLVLAFPGNMNTRWRAKFCEAIPELYRKTVTSNANEAIRLHRTTTNYRGVFA